MLPGVAAAQTGPRATVLYDGRAIGLSRVTAEADALWIQKTDLPAVNGFELKPQGACREEICIPIPRAMMRGTQFNLTAFAQRIGQRVVADPDGARMELWRDPGGARRVPRIADRPGVLGPGSQRPPGQAVAVPRQEGVGGHLGILVRVPT